MTFEATLDRSQKAKPVKPTRDGSLIQGLWNPYLNEYALLLDEKGCLLVLTFKLCLYVTYMNKSIIKICRQKCKWILQSERVRVKSS